MLDSTLIGAIFVLTKSDKELNRKNMKNIIEQQIESAEETYQKELARIQYNRSRSLLALKEIEAIRPKIEAMLIHEHYEIAQFHCGKTGLHSDWDENSKAKINITLKPTSGKVRFITFDGYTASGSGRNQKRLNAKAEKLEDSIKKFTGVGSVRVNQFSFEVKEKGEQGTVLVDMWL